MFFSFFVCLLLVLQSKQPRRDMSQGCFLIIVSSLKLVAQQFRHLVRHRVLAGPHRQTVHLRLSIGLESQKTTNLHPAGVDDASANKVFWIGVHAFEELYAETQELCFCCLRIHGQIGFEDLLHFLTGVAEVFPTREKRLRIHFGWFKESVYCHGKM